MAKKLRLLFTLLFIMVAGSIYAQTDMSAVYTSNVKLDNTVGTSASVCVVKISNADYDGLKAGTGKVAGAIEITVPKGTKYLHLHAAGWNGESVTLEVSPSEYSSNIALTANSGISGNSPFTFNGNPSTSDYYKVITFATALTKDTELTFTASSGKRFVVFGVNAEEESKPKHKVEFYQNGYKLSEAEVEETKAIVFPTAAEEISGKKFVGWLPEEIDGTTDEASPVNSAIMGTADVTFYAVFANVTPGTATQVTDELTRATTGVTGTSYSEWSGKTVTSAAVYAGQSAGGNESIQLRSDKSNSGIITTTSGGKLKKVVVEWNSSTTDGRTLNVYGSNIAYKAATDLYNTSKQGTKLGSIVYGTSTELTIDGEYTFIGLRSNSGAMYLDNISITWENGTPDTYSDYCTTVAKPVIARVTHCSGLDEDGVEESWSSINCTTAEEVEQNVSLNICDDFSGDWWYADRVWVYGEVNANLTLGKDQYVIVSELGEDANFTGNVTAAEGYIIVTTDVKSDFNEVYERTHKSAILYSVRRDPNYAKIKIVKADGSEFGYDKLFTTGLHSTMKLDDGDKMILQDDVDYGNNTPWYPYVNLTIDLNGHSLTNSKGSALGLSPNKTLTIMDSSEEQTGTVSVAENIRNSETVSASRTGAKLIINGGNFIAPKDSNKGVLIAGDNTEVIINGGTFQGTLSITEGSTANITISGGIFDKEVPAEFCAEGMVPCQLGENKYSVRFDVEVAAPVVFHDSGEYEAGLSVPMYAQAGEIYYTIGEGQKTKYTAPLTINETSTVTAWAEIDGVESDKVTKTFTIVTKAEAPSVDEGYYSIKNGTGKYINVAGRKTVTFTDAIDDKAGTVLKVKTGENGQVEVLRSQGVDLPGYADRAMNYVPKFVKLIVDKLHAEGSGEILGENGLDAIMKKFNESFDYHLYIENANENDNAGYRIYGKTPSMKPVVDFYAENKANVDYKLPKLEAFINSAIQKVLQKTGGRGASILTEFKLHDIWQKMGSTLTEPVDEASTAKFYEEVLASEANVWNFAYQTAMTYWNNVKNHPRYDELKGKLGEYAKYIEKVENIQPDFKYYIVGNTSGNGVDFISEGNTDINAARATWTLEKRTGFKVTFNKENSINLGRELYTTLYTDFAYTVPEKVKAYKVTAIDEKTGLATKEEISGVIPAQTPVLLQMIVDPKTVTDADLTQTLTLSTEAGTAVTGNLLQGPDALINKFEIKTDQVVSLFEMAKSIMGEEFYNTYVKEYEHLMMKNAGTVNNKYFFGIGTAEDTDNKIYSEGTTLRILFKGDKKLGFYQPQDIVKANTAFILDETNPVLLSLVGDVTRDGKVNISDVTAQIDIILDKDTPEDNYDYDAADVDGNGEIKIKDVTDLIDIILGKDKN